MSHVGGGGGFPPTFSMNGRTYRRNAVRFRCPGANPRAVAAAGGVWAAISGPNVLSNSVPLGVLGTTFIFKADPAFGPPRHEVKSQSEDNPPQRAFLAGVMVDTYLFYWQCNARFLNLMGILMVAVQTFLHFSSMQINLSEFSSHFTLAGFLLLKSVPLTCSLCPLDDCSEDVWRCVSIASFLSLCKDLLGMRLFFLLQKTSKIFTSSVFPPTVWNLWVPHNEHLTFPEYNNSNIQVWLH